MGIQESTENCHKDVQVQILDDVKNCQKHVKQMSANIANVEASVSTHANLAWKPYTSNGGKLAEIIDITNTLRSAKHD